MPGTNVSWYNGNAARRYPFDDRATCVGDDGSLLRDNILVGLTLSWPEEFGRYAFVTGLTVTPQLVSVVVSASDTPTDTTPGEYNPIAAITVRQPVVSYRHYAVTPLQPGVAGFAAFDDARESGAWRFSTPAQGLLLASECHAYEPLPIPSLSKYGRPDVLSGIVEIAAGAGLVASAEPTLVAGLLRDAVVLRLAGEAVGGPSLASLAGPCGGRPESRTCRRPGIESINEVLPDCDGNISLTFEGFTTAPYDSCGSENAGIVLDQDVGLDAVCLSQDVSRYIGVDYCAPGDSSSVSNSASLLLPPPGLRFDEIEEIVPCEDLPFVSDLSQPLHHSWRTRTGAYVHSETGIRVTDASRPLLLTWNDCGYQLSYFKRVGCCLSLSRSAGPRRAGLVLNLDSTPATRYLFLAISQSEGSLVLYRETGGGAVLLHQVPLSGGVQYDHRYSITVSLSPYLDSQLQLHAETYNQAGDRVAGMVIVLPLLRYGPATGKHGLLADRTAAEFHSWTIEEL